MKLTTWILSGCALLAAVLVAIFGDTSIAGWRFLARLAVLATVLVALVSALVIRSFGRDANRKLWGTVVLLAISATAALAASEFVLRIAFQDVTTTSDNSSYFARRWYAMHPSERNSLGFRERDISREKAPDTYRIAIIGDSFAYGQGVLDEERFSNLLQAELDQSSGNYEVLNFGKPGAETDEHLRILDEFVLDLSPDFVLLQWFVNDVEILKSDRAAPMRLVPSSFAHSWLHEHSALYYLMNWQWTMLQSTLGLTEQHIDNMTRRFGNPDSEESQAATAALEQLLGRLRERNIPAGLVLFPMMVDTKGDPGAYPLGFLMDRILAICRVEDTPCLDLRPVFAASLAESDLWSNRLDHHPGAAAHKVAGSAILARFGTQWAPQ